MAVIRSSRLFTHQAQPQALSALLPARQPARPEPRTRWDYVYTCPVGQRAIIRSLTAQIQQLPVSGASSYYVNLEPGTVAGGGIGGITVGIHWAWFYDHRASSPGVVELGDTWNTMLVLHPGDKLVIANLTGFVLMTQASGHLLPVTAQ